MFVYMVFSAVVAAALVQERLCYTYHTFVNLGVCPNSRHTIVLSPKNWV